jgi:hypothetical protein
MAQLRRFTTGILPIVAFAACSQIIGLSEYEKGQEPDDSGGESSGGDGGKGGTSGTSTGGRAGRGGSGGKGGTAGTGTSPGGEGGVGGEGGQDEGGAAGSSTGGSRGGTSGRGGSGGKATTGGSSGAGGLAGSGAAGGAGGGMGGSNNAGGGMGGSAGTGCTTVPIALRGADFDSDTPVWASYGDPSARTLIVTGASVGLTPPSAPNLAHFGQVNDWYAGHFQRIQVPVGAVTMTLTGSRYITTLETSGTDNDVMGIQLWDNAVTAEGRIGTFVQFSNLDATNSWVEFNFSIAVSSRAGQMVDFDMWAENNLTSVTNFYVDSLVLTAFVCL